jgi:hypothetical protein
MNEMSCLVQFRAGATPVIRICFQDVQSSLTLVQASDTTTVICNLLAKLLDARLKFMEMIILVPPVAGQRRARISCRSLSATR